MAIQTYGELRQALLRENLRWTVNPAFADRTPMECGDGALHCNFELIAQSAGHSLTHWWRDNSSASRPWAHSKNL
jgi:hypothetical protein